MNKTQLINAVAAVPNKQTPNRLRRCLYEFLPGNISQWRQCAIGRLRRHYGSSEPCKNCKVEMGFPITVHRDSQNQLHNFKEADIH